LWGGSLRSHHAVLALDPLHFALGRSAFQVPNAMPRCEMLDVARQHDGFHERQQHFIMWEDKRKVLMLKQLKTCLIKVT
jgi:hypothetical protein